MKSFLKKAVCICMSVLLIVISAFAAFATVDPSVSKIDFTKRKVIEPGKDYSAIIKAGGYAVYKYSPTETDYYTFTQTSGGDTIVYLCDKTGKCVVDNFGNVVYSDDITDYAGISGISKEDLLSIAESVPKFNVSNAFMPTMCQLLEAGTDYYFVISFCEKTESGKIEFSFEKGSEFDFDIFIFNTDDGSEKPEFNFDIKEFFNTLKSLFEKLFATVKEFFSGLFDA